MLLSSTIALSMPSPVGAQLVSETVNDTSRTCVYYGSDVSPDGQVTPRNVVVGLGQECPAVAPHRDANAPVPPNALLTGEQTNANNRICLYNEAGIEYRLTIAMTLRCAVTPALAQQAQAATR